MKEKCILQAWTHMPWLDSFNVSSFRSLHALWIFVCQCMQMWQVHTIPYGCPLRHTHTKKNRDLPLSKKEKGGLTNLQYGVLHHLTVSWTACIVFALKFVYINLQLWLYYYFDLFEGTYTPLARGSSWGC